MTSLTTSKAVGAGSLAHQFEAWNAHALKRVRRAAWLVGAAAQEAGSGSLYALCGLEDLRFIFDGARTGHHDDLFAAELHAVGEFDDGAFGTEASACQLVGRTDAMNVQHAGQIFEFGDVEVAVGPTPARMVWVAPVVRWTPTPASTMTSMTKSICSSVAFSCIATIIFRSLSRAQLRRPGNGSLLPGCGRLCPGPWGISL